MLGISKKKMLLLRFHPTQVLAIGFLVIILIGSVLLSLPISIAHDDVHHSYFDALFMAASATCVTGLTVVNVGEHYSIFGQVVRKGSLMHYVDDPFVNVIAIVLIILGGIGFIVISDLLTYRKNKKLTLHSKVVLTVSGLLFALGALVIFVFEFTNPHTLQPLSPVGKALGALFQSISSRSSGLNTIDTSSLRQATQFFIIILMLIGAAVSMIRGKEDIVMFRLRIAKDRIYKATTFAVLSFLLIVIGSMALSTTESFPFLGILFEVTSAYATAGMSMGLTAQLTPAGQMIIIILMFIGRLGPVTLAYSLTIKPEKDLYRYPQGKITIG